jgi:hypothetical protein
MAAMFISPHADQRNPWREWMGVEPTAARSARPATNFEDWGNHRATTTPIEDYSQKEQGVQCLPRPRPHRFPKSYGVLSTVKIT